MDLVLDIARLVQPSLNLLRALRRLETDLEASRQELLALRDLTAQQWGLGPLETRDPWFAKHVLEPLRRVSGAERGGVLILGPTGSGKSHLAQACHSVCRGRNGPFVTLDCAQVTSAETLAAELFGYADASGYSSAPARGRPGRPDWRIGARCSSTRSARCPPTCNSAC